MAGDGPERQINLHVVPEQMAGAYANFANVSHSEYEFTITFARVDHEVQEGEVPGVVVSRMNLAPRFMRELIDALEEDWSRYETQEGIKGLPETPPPRRRAVAKASAWPIRSSVVGWVPKRTRESAGGSGSETFWRAILVWKASKVRGSRVSSSAKASARRSTSRESWLEIHVMGGTSSARERATAGTARGPERRVARREALRQDRHGPHAEGRHDRDPQQPVAQVVVVHVAELVRDHEARLGGLEVAHQRVVEHDALGLADAADVGVGGRGPARGVHLVDLAHVDAGLVAPAAARRGGAPRPAPG